MPQGVAGGRHLWVLPHLPQGSRRAVWGTLEGDGGLRPRVQVSQGEPLQHVRRHARVPGGGQVRCGVDLSNCSSNATFLESLT